MKKSIYTYGLTGLFVLFVLIARGQTKVYETFKDTRVINTQSTETLRKGYLDFRVGHRFGDIAGAAGGWPTFYGLETATDVSIGFDYGVTDKLMIGIHRTKGSSELRQNVSGTVKLKLMEQEIDGSKPFSLAVLGVMSTSTMESSTAEGVITNFDVFAHRISYHLQVLIAKKIQRLSLQLGGSWTYRNLVPSTDQNDLASIAGALKFQISKPFALIFDANVPFSPIRTAENGFFPALGVGLEWETGGGHVFQINFTNATGIAETDFVPYTRSNWADGEFRLGFTIARQFRIR